MAKGKNEDVELLPEDGDNNELDISNLRVNFSSEEASSEALDFTPVPTGKYHCAITDIELRRAGPEAKNPGAPYWAVELTCQSGPYENRKFWANVMLFDGALFSLSQLMKATGHADVVKEGSPNYGKIPSADSLIGEEVIITVVKTLDRYKMEREESTDKIFKNEVKGFRALAGSSVGVGSSGDSLMP